MDKLPRFGARHSLALMGFFGILNVFISRNDLSIAIIAMVGREAVQKTGSNESLCLKDPYDAQANMSSVRGEFDWGLGSKGDLLGAYFYGYIFSQIFGAYLASKIGFKLTWGFSMFGSGVLTLLIPTVARFGGLAPLIALRVFIGLSHGVGFACMHAAWSVWAPPLERSKLVAAHMAGASAGTCTILPIGGLLAAQFGWPAVFYFTGTSNLIWSICWFFVVFDSPDLHPRISSEERDYIVNTIQTYQLKSFAAKDESSMDDKKSDSIPWKAILTSPTVLAVSAAQFTSLWGLFQMNALLPTYLDSVLQFNMATNGLVSAVPYICQSILVFSTGYITDIILTRKLLRTVTMRKINTALGHVVPAVAIVLAGYMGCNKVAAMAMFTISVSFNGCAASGSKANMLDFAPKYSGVIFAISNTVGSMSGFLAPQLTGHLLDISNSIEQWQLAFWITASIYIPGLIVFLFYGTDKIQSWAE